MRCSEIIRESMREFCGVGLCIVVRSKDVVATDVQQLL